MVDLVVLPVNGDGWGDVGRPLIDQNVVAAARRLLALHQPLAIADLATLLAEEGLTPPIGGDSLDWALDHVIALPGGWLLPDRRMIHAETLYEGLVLTHQLTSAEIATGMLAMEPDLIPLLLLSRVDNPDSDEDPYLVLAGGGRGILGCFLPLNATGYRDQFALRVPPGWLGKVAEGDLVALRINHGHVSVCTLTEPPLLPDEEIGRLLSAYGTVSRSSPGNAEPEPSAEILDVFVVALAEGRGTFQRPMPPLAEVFAATGLQVRGRRLVKPRELTLTDLDGLDEVGAVALRILLDAYELFVTDRMEVMETLQLAPIILARMLAGPMVATSFVVQTLLPRMENETENEPKVAAFARALLGDHSFNAGPHLVLAFCADARGDPVAGEEHVIETLRLYSHQAEAQQLASLYAEDRGDAARALDCLRKAGGNPDPARVARLEHFASPGPATAALGDPCPCGSGRAHGLCCARRNGHPLHTRAEWLFAKARGYLLRPPVLMALRPIAQARARNDPGPFAWQRTALSDPLVQDLGLFEGGVLVDFLDVRGVLLPADELELGRSWVGIRRSLYEITTVAARAHRMTLRDLATGDEVDVTEETAVRALSPGVLLYARVVPDGRGHRLIGAVLPIPTSMRLDMLGLLDRDPVDIASWFASIDGQRRS